MADTLEGRVQEIEDLIADIPQMMSLRLESLTAAQQDASARIGLLDKQMAMMMREMRDLRGGVTRMLVAQDAEIAAIKADVTEFKAGLASIKGDVTEFKAGLAGIKGDVTEFKAGLASIKGDVSEMKVALHMILARLPPS